MELKEAIYRRKSIRGFKADPVPRQVIEEILRVAVRAPSANNTQPWEFAVLTGRVLDAAKSALMKEVESGAGPAHEVPDVGYTGVYRERAVALGRQLYGLMDIARQDKARRSQWGMKGVRFFDAPAAILAIVDRSVEDGIAIFDLGAICQTICLVALEHGLGTCIQRQGVMFPRALREAVGLPETKRPIVSIAVGYPDPFDPANRIESAREAVEGTVSFMGFE